MKVVRFATFLFAQAVDDQNVPGYQHVDRLAEYLVKLREQTSLCLTKQQTSAIIAGWEKLDDLCSTTPGETFEWTVQDTEEALTNSWFKEHHPLHVKCK